MIVEQIRGDIIASKHNHIVFGSNIEGYNDAGFAGLISSRFWPELANAGPQKMGDVLTHVSNGRTFHAIVCHSLKKGWDGAPKAIQKGLDSIELKNPKSSIGVVLIGNGPVGLMQGADGEANLKAMEKSTKKIVVYSL